MCPTDIDHPRGFYLTIEVECSRESDLSGIVDYRKGGYVTVDGDHSSRSFHTDFQILPWEGYQSWGDKDLMGGGSYHAKGILFTSSLISIDTFLFRASA